MRSLQFKPTDKITFVPHTSGGFRGQVLLTNVNDTYVVFKVKTNKAERYAVKPHMGILEPGQSQIVSFTVQPKHLDAFIEDMVSQSNSGRSHTAFLFMAWLPGDDFVATALQSGQQETVLEVLRQGWKDTEEADKGKPPGESAFEQKRFAADWWDGTAATESEAGAAPAAAAAGGAGSGDVSGSGVSSNDKTAIGDISGAAASAAAAAAPAASSGDAYRSAAGLPSAAAAAPAATPAADAKRAGVAGSGSAAAAAAPAAAPAGEVGVARAGSAGGDENPAAPSPAVPAAGGAGAAGAGAAAGGAVLTGVEAERLRARVNQLTAEVLALKGERESAVHGLTQRDEELRGLRARVANLDAQLVALQSLGPAGTGADGSGARRRAGKGGAGAGTGGADDSEDEEEGGAGGRGGGFPLWQLLLIAVLMLGVGFALARTGLV